MSIKYTQKSMRELNLRVYDRGISVKIKNPYTITSETDLNILERQLSDHSEEFKEDAVFVEWGRPFGGPSDGFRIQKYSDIKELQKAYMQTQADGIYPKAGFVIDKFWIETKRKYLKPISDEFNLTAFFKKVLIKKI